MADLGRAPGSWACARVGIQGRSGGGAGGDGRARARARARTRPRGHQSGATQGRLTAQDGPNGWSPFQQATK